MFSISLALYTSDALYIFGSCLIFIWLPWCLSGKESTCQYGKCKRLEFDPWVGMIPWSRDGYSLQDSPWGHKRIGQDLVIKQQWWQQLILMASLMAQMVKNLPAVQETWVWPLGWEDTLEKEMATCSSIPAWRIPWTDDPMGYSP